jgi:CBS domain-containing protein
MKTGIKVSDAMTQQPIFIGPDQTLTDCSIIMKENHVGAVLVKESDKIIGICTEQDIVRKAVAERKDCSKVLIREVIDTNVKTISSDKDIFEAIVKMKDFNIRHLPVVDSQNKHVGLLTLKDILKIEPQLFDILVDAIELREEKNKPIKCNKEDEGLCQLCGEYTEELTKNEDGIMICKKCN